MQVALDFMNSHICEAASSMVPAKPRNFEFSFHWECGDEFRPYDFEKTCLSDVKWNFSNLDRSDRIHMVFNTLHDNLVKEEKKNEKDQSKKQKIKANEDLHVTS